MGEFRKNALSFFRAARYSLAFCWRNDKEDTRARLLLALFVALSSYVVIWVSGLLFNRLQHAGGHFGPLVLPLTLFFVMQVVDMYVTRSNVFTEAMWQNRLRYENKRELNHHRSMLDVALIRSERYDNLCRKIEELPNGWDARTTFADGLLDICTMAGSFIVFGISLLWYKPIYALVLLAFAVPKVISEFGIVTMWWKLYERRVPNNKIRRVLERPYFGETPYVQAQMFTQWRPLERLVAGKVKEILDDFEKTGKEAKKRKSATSFLGICVLMLVMIHATWSTVVFGGGIGTLMIIINSARNFQSNLNAIMMRVADQWNNAQVVLLIEEEFMKLEPELKTPNPIVPDFKVPHLRFDRVSFTYEQSDKKALDEVSFEIAAGSKVAIVGKSGNGKSTILSLLMRQFEPTSGAIYADDINLRNIEPLVWSNYATALTQDYTILERPIGEEIASSRLGEDIDLTKVKRSAEFACFDGVVAEDDEGYTKQVGADFGGREFSGGERQRFALARTIYRGTPIIILDEPDARLDPDSADKVMENIFGLEGVTVIIITHHVSRAEGCDSVIVMGKGKVVEQGSPSELLAHNGDFARLYRSDKKRLGNSAEA